MDQKDHVCHSGTIYISTGSYHSNSAVLVTVGEVWNVRVGTAVAVINFISNIDAQPLTYVVNELFLICYLA